MQSSPSVIRISAVLVLAIVIGCKPEPSQPTNAISTSPTETTSTAPNPEASKIANTPSQVVEKKDALKGKSLQFDRFSFSLPDRFVFGQRSR